MSTNTDRSLRVHRYLTTAAAGMAAAAGSAEAAIVTSASAGWTGETRFVTGTNAPRAVFTDFGDTKLNNAFDAQVNESRVNSVRYRWGGLSNGNTAGYGGYLNNARLASGAVISGGMAGGFNGLVFLATSAAGSAAGDWNPYGAGAWKLGAGTGADSVRGYLGFQFSVGGGTYYGYFDVEISRTGRERTTSTFSMTIHGWAYNDVAGQSITIGASAVPGGAGLASLAVGALGLRGRRRSRSA